MTDNIAIRVKNPLESHTTMIFMPQTILVLKLKKAKQLALLVKMAQVNQHC
jgi:uncharacterized protein with PQ loop repeat